MKAKFLLAAAALSIMASMALANTPNNSLGAFTNDAAAQPQGSPSAGNTDSYVLASPFNNRVRQDRTDMRPTDGRARSSLPPAMDASGVPDPRI